MICTQQPSNRLIKITKTLPSQRELIENEMPCLIIGSDVFVPMDCKPILNKLFPTAEQKIST